MSLEQQILATFKRNGFGIAAELMELNRFNRHQLRNMLNSWSNYPACMDKYPTHLLVKRTILDSGEVVTG